MYVRFLLQVKCVKYWPDADSQPYADFTVTVRKEDIWPDYTIREITLAKVGTPMDISTTYICVLQFSLHGDLHPTTCVACCINVSPIIFKSTV